jgi:hypothetical protein
MRIVCGKCQKAIFESMKSYVGEMRRRDTEYFAHGWWNRPDKDEWEEICFMHLGATNPGVETPPYPKHEQACQLIVHCHGDRAVYNVFWDKRAEDTEYEAGDELDVSRPNDTATVFAGEENLMTYWPPLRANTELVEYTPKGTRKKEKRSN